VALVQRLTSRQHPIVKRFRRVAARKPGDTAVLLDGEHVIADALDAGVPLEAILTDGRPSAVARRARASGVNIVHGSAAVLDAASPVRTSSGIVAIAEWSPVPADAALAGTPAFAIGLVDVQDPGNVGSVIRAADALGATGVIALEQSADPGGWKALRGAMGSTFHLPVARGRLRETVAEARRRGLRVTATVASGGDAPGGLDLTQPRLVLLGSEGAGLSGAAIQDADDRITIPMRSGVNSLNVAVTAALILFEARRQREGRA